MIKRFAFPLLFFPLLSSFISSAQTVNRCGSMLYLRQHPDAAAKIQRDETALQQEIHRLATTRRSFVTYTIPVVVHVVWNTAAEQISSAQVQSQIDVLNEDYGRTNADTVNTPPAFQSLAANTQIQFCLAQHDPGGNPTNGIEYTQTAVTGFTNPGDVTSASTGGADPWDMNHYMNIWVCNLSSGILETGFFPASGSPGIIVLYSAFGRVGNVNPPYDKGRSATHAMGHCFNLLHTWADDSGDCTGSDSVADTPNQGDASYGCPSFPLLDACSPSSPGVMFMNYMDYSDDACLNLFTQGQAMRMLATLNLYYTSLLNSTSCSPVAAHSQIKGTVYYDANQNGLRDTGDIGLASQKLLVLPDSDYYFTDYNGEYTLFLDTGTLHTVVFVPDPYWLLTSDSASFSFLADTGTTCCFNFGTFPGVATDRLQISLSYSRMRCDTVVPFWINYRNTGTTLESGVIRMNFDDSLSFVSSTPAPDIRLTDTLYWNFTNLQPGESRLIWMTMHTSQPDTIPVCAYAAIHSNSGMAGDSDGFCRPITCSFDPNDKEVNPEGIQTAHYTLKNTRLEYTVRFQNTGNDTAFTVLIRDTLNRFFDFNTFQILGYSHPVITSLDNQHIAAFRFNHIALPPASIDESRSHGFIKYSLYAQPGLPDTVVIDNTAHIFFDSNVPVETNRVFNTLLTVLPTGIPVVSGDSPYFTIYPNPASTLLTVVLSQQTEITITDLPGQVILRKNLSTAGFQKAEFNISTLSPGLYFVKAGDRTKPFVKE